MRSKNAIPGRERVMEVLFRYPTKKMHLRDLSRRSGLSATSVLKISKYLEKEKMVIREKTPHIVNYIANNENRKFREAKRIWNLEKITESGIVDQIAKESRPDAIVLFGSFARGEDWEQSDIDMAVINPRGKVSHNVEKSKNLPREVEIHKIKKPYPKELTNNIINGILLYGRWKLL